jgi:tetratricopeptide (TPR) repeat protein
MTDRFADYSARYRELLAALERAGSRAERARLAPAVLQLCEEAGGIARQLAELQKSLRQLVDRYGLVLEAEQGPAMGVAPAAPVVEGDELGAILAGGWAYIDEGDYGQAREAFGKALRLAPDDARALSSLGWVQTISQDYDEALVTYQHLLVANPDDVLARVNLGFICLKKSIYGEAIEHLSKAIRGDTDPRVLIYGNFYLGQVYLAREMYGDAETFFQEAVKLNPVMGEAYFQLGRARYLAGRRADAISAWKDGAANQQDDFWATRCAESARATESGGRPLLD